MEIRKLKCIGDYSVYPHDLTGYIKGFTFVLQVDMPLYTWVNHTDCQHYSVDIHGKVFECDAYIKAYTVDLYTHLISEITLVTTGEVKG